MSNPFLVPGSANQAELARLRRQKFKTSAYALLLATTCFLLGMLIQGCNDQHRSPQHADGGEIAAAR